MATEASRGNIQAVVERLAALERRLEEATPEQVACLRDAFDDLRHELDALRTATPRAEHEGDQRLFQTLMDSIPDGIYFKDRAGRFLKINRGQADNLGIADEREALGKTDFDFFGHEHAEEAQVDEQRILQTREPMLDRVEHYVGTDGRPVWVSATKVPIYDRNGSPIGIAGISRDITARKEAESTLDRERAFLKTLLSSLTEGIVACDANGVLTLFNDAARAFHNLPQEQIPADQWAEYYDLFHPDGKTPLRTEEIPLFRALQGEHVRGVEMMIVPRQGTPRTVLSNGQPLFDANGNKLGAVVAMHDITERKQAEANLRAAKAELETRVAERTAELREANRQLQIELAEREAMEQALRDSEMRFRTLIEQSPLSTQIFAPDGRTIQVNHAWEQLWGVTLDQIPEYNVLHDPQLDAKGITPYLKHAFAGDVVEVPAILYDPEETIPGRTSHTAPQRWVRAVAYPVKDEAGRIREVALVHEDISEQMRIAAQIQESEERFRQLAENITEVFWMFDAETLAMLYISPAYEQVWGRSCASLYEHPRSFLHAILPEDRELVDACLKRQLNGEQTVSEYRVMQPSGGVRWIRDRGFPIRDSSGRVYRVAGIAEDMTERKLVEDERAALLISERAARTEAEAALVLRDEFLTIASHELKTPVTTLLAYSQILDRRFQRESTASDRDRRAIRVIADQTERLSRLIGSVLDIGRISIGQFSLASRPVDLRDVARRVVEEMQPALEQHSITASWPAEPVVVEGDDLRLEQVLQNLLQNAIKYSPDGGRIKVEITREDDEATLAVSDQGIGIPAEAHARLFQRFYRAGNIAETGIAGMGLGLYVVKEIVDRHHGSVEVASVENQGSTFTVRLPLNASA